MDINKRDNSGEVTIKDLYPHLNDDQQREAEENLNRYVALVLRVYERIRTDAAAYKRLKRLTESDRDSTMEHKPR